MPTLTEKGQMKIAEIAEHHGVSSAAASHLLAAIIAGNGRQAQFDHPELGGMGQWSRGGMIMIGDMFNHALKARVGALCNELAETFPDASAIAPQDNRGPPPEPDVAPAAPASRWPADWGPPSSTGSQNDMHYAVFPDAQRLAIEQHGTTTVYDTGDHRIGGVSQQQAAERSLAFTSQLGPVVLSDLKIAGDQTAPAPAAAGDADDEIFARLERLADLHGRQIISAEEFAAKKAELLARL